MLRPTLLLLALAGCATTSTTAFYPLDELRALDGPDGKDELLTHAMDVAPSMRNDEWRSLVERAAIATLAEVEVKNAQSAERALALVDSLSGKYPPLKKSKGWLAKRADVGVKSFGWLLQTSRSQEWTARILDFAKADPVTPHLAQRLADEVVLKQLIPVTATSLYELALERDGAAVCEAPNLARIAVDHAAEGSELKAATALCWKQLEGPLVEAIKKSETHTAKLKLCAALAPHLEAAAVKAACNLEQP